MGLKLEDCILYAVTDTSWLRGQTLAQQVEAALRGGATMVQLREKELEGEALEQEAREILAVCRKYGVPLLINDDVMLAKKIGAEGVHVGQSDMAAAEARSILGPDAIIGVTARTVEQAQAAEKAGADYLGSGAVFGTSTKKDAKPLDPAYFQQICESVSIPVVAIGGITANNIRQLEGRKMSGFAIVSGIFAAQDVEAQTKKLWKAAQELCLPGGPERLRALVEKRRPVVQCITNIVTVNDCANALLAIGGSPTMAHHPEEMADFAAVSDALVCNMGATESLDAMMAAGMASKNGRPVVIDPVGCASSAFRRGKCLELIKAVQPSCIRGNAAEIKALATDHNTGRGVDDLEAETPDAARSAMDLARKTGAIVVASGETDYIADGIRLYEVKGGTAWMSRVTGTGCMLSSLLGAFLAVENSALSAAACCAMMNTCAEKALAETAGRQGGTGTFHICLMDALSGRIQ
ncbi:MAG: hydroxyethylthiazole kinase [Lachnospiraceae bacterium]|nr:hydroxyethylthiazole kinase [Lachnospiraceae bacterium]